jgi:hypothetical protein
MARGFGSAGKTDPVDQWVAGERSATGFSVPGNYIENPWWKTNFFENPGKFEHWGRGML